ncbi:MAG: hypothetical protein SGILL_005643, partial [Bacillariaceae sp.]
MVENTLTTTEEPSPVLMPEKSLEKSKTKKKKSNSSSSLKKQKKSDDVEWCNTTEDDIDSEEDWEPVESHKENPSTWDPKELNEQTNEMGSWKEKNEARRVQDLPSPTLADVPPEQRKCPADNGEEWPFEKACAFEEKNR